MPRPEGKGLLSRLSRGGTRTTETISTGDLNKRRIALLHPESFVAEQFPFATEIVARALDGLTEKAKPTDAAGFGRLPRKGAR